MPQITRLTQELIAHGVDIRPDIYTVDFCKKDLCRTVKGTGGAEMIKDITIGQYIAGDSPIHKMDARVKILAAMLFIVLLFVIRSAATYVIMTLFVLFMVKLSGVPVNLFCAA